MIRLTGLVDLSAFAKRPVGSAIKEELTDKQKKLDVDGDGEIEGSDLAKLRDKNEATGADHEVSMANSTLDDIIKNATELKQKMGTEEKDIPAWIQDHISQAQNFINQANTNYHEHDTPEDKGYNPTDESTVSELSPDTLNRAAAKASDNWERDDTADAYHHSKGVEARKKKDIPTAKKHAVQAKKYTAKAQKSANQAQKFASAHGEKIKKPGATWTTSSGHKATRNQDGTITYTDK